ncbi:MAG: 30S ribosomal protein S6 [Gammaproteobacteria bacterium]|uniref:Small ribosomal subunit protein bS6 n=1 Tax=SAR86 cluster bacterium TaxID=2030880 RepID=A0A520N1J1_9GAMM|nr:30S ribosomal protein S6 [Gammaproteobacteria bacterium]MBA4729568.1 30S ribosomal protein S6 [SAR86 cluster bacterium]RPG34899.1 MAG: 30S ribosomal protein S6 [Gammaproteobacteria bacterium TMED193]RZO27324.1 MAG: 30S ribosomal protein S6 [SAR86 cluster bacterium]|tara:strand:- start:6981 stop:7286 length:306 start_codon:yes stop_codon:yes gene_type:complete
MVEIRNVMQNYELMLLINPNIGDAMDSLLESIKKIISDNKGELTDTKILGKRQLAYPINNMNFANYVHLDLKVDKSTLKTLEEKFKFEQDVYRHLTVKIGK